MKNRFSILFLSSLLFLPACFNRPAPDARSLPVQSYGVESGRPTLIAFSALWCHPCREEIETLNKANQEFSSQIQIVGYLLEGEEKGSPVQDSDLAKFTSFTGEAPLYPIRMDKNWQLFDKSRAPQGRALPTLVVIDSEGHTQEIVQQSLDYDTQLRPLLLALLNGQTAPTVEAQPTPPPVQAGSQQFTDSVQNWLARPEVAVNSTLQTNLKSSWQTGLAKYDFTTEEMPLEAGSITFTLDAQGVNTPQTVGWHAETPSSICQLHLILNADGTLNSLSGSCRPK